MRQKQPHKSPTPQLTEPQEAANKLKEEVPLKEQAEHAAHLEKQARLEELEAETIPQNPPAQNFVLVKKLKTIVPSGLKRLILVLRENMSPSSSLLRPLTTWREWIARA